MNPWWVILSLAVPGLSYMLGWYMGARTTGTRMGRALARRQEAGGMTSREADEFLEEFGRA